MWQKIGNWYRWNPFWTVLLTISTLLLIGIVAIDVWRSVSVDYRDLRRNQLHNSFDIDLKKYAGKWYEIASLPAPFQSECECTSAEYTQRSDGLIKVFNQCTTAQGEQQSITGVAWPHNANNTWLKVSFAGAILPTSVRRALESSWPFTVAAGDYLILYVEPDYSVAMVGTPSRDSFWLLSRQKQMSDDKFALYMQLARTKGYNTNNVRKTCQS